MLYFILTNGRVSEVRESLTGEEHRTLNYVCRPDFKELADADSIAKQVTELTGDLHIATDAGPWVRPQYDVIRAPAVGDKVSREFNGDSYPAGEIVKVSKSLKVVTTDTGVRFSRVKESGGWRSQQTWWMTQGHVDKRNPSF